jgi:hypothetical protein
MCSACSCHEIKQATSPTMAISFLFSPQHQQLTSMREDYKKLITGILSVTALLAYAVIKFAVEFAINFK